MSDNNFIDKLIESLNDKQKEAVLSRNQHIRVLAGAGSGKTKVLTTRIAYLQYLGSDAASILAVTFTNKAAAEMKERIATLLPENLKHNLNKLWIGTFHGLCNRIISAHHSILGLPKNYEIIDSADQKSIVRRILEELAISEDKKEVIKESLIYINGSKEKGFRPEESLDYLQSLGFPMMLLEIYKRYEDIRISSNALDFGDILLYVHELFRSNPEVKKYYQDKFQHILVDEYQDTNDIQEQWLSDISYGNYLYVVGDDDQSIYGWRGAKIDNIMNFKKRFPNSETVKLEQNYRSTNKILTAANEIIKNNKKREGKNLWSAQDGGENLLVQQCSSPEEEARNISAYIENEVENNGKKPSDFAILYRNNSLSRAFESKLTERMVPYKIIGGIGFWSRKEIKDILSYLSMFNNESNDVSFERTINFPTRGIGKKTLLKIRETALNENISMLNAVKDLLLNNEIKGKAAQKIQNYISIIKNGKKMKGGAPFNLIMHVLDNTDITEAYNKEGEEKSDERKLNIQELVYFSRNFKNEDENKSELEAFLYHASLQSDADKQKDGDLVQLMTIHASKGLEFPHVFIVGFEQGVFPSKRSIDNKNSLEEERRLAYVAITRGEKTVDFSFCEWRYNQQSSLSMFLNELPLEILDFKSNSEYGICELGRKITDYKYNRENEGYNDTSDTNTNTPVKKAVKKINRYDVGDFVNHKKYGEGEIISIYKKDNTLVAKVDFGFIGKKDLIIERF
jgi:DNA helicase-2/ATP-dependent DNA helicase PcrA